MKKVVVLGAGISGLTAAWTLRDTCDVTVVEASGEPGGVMQSLYEPAFFDLGPRTFRGAESLQELAKEAGVPLLEASPHAKRRYIYWKKKLRSLPPKPYALFSPVVRTFLGGIWRDLRAAVVSSDETIGDFARRRFGPRAAEMFFDPVVKGVFAGDMDRLSVQECFPKMKEWEKNFGSVVKGMKQIQPKKLFTIAGGTGALTKALASQLNIRYNTRVLSLTPHTVYTDRGAMDADLVICALPVSALRHIESPHQALFSSIETVSLTVAHVCLPRGTRIPKGFGYLVPRSEKADVLGAVFDSVIFPEQSDREEVRLTVMLKSVDHVEKKVARALNEHLGVKILPEVVKIVRYDDVLPQYGLGHADLISPLQNDAKIVWVGNYLKGASVGACIDYAKQAARSAHCLPTALAGSKTPD